MPADAGVEHQDAVGQPCRGQAVGHDDGRTPGRNSHEPLVYRLFLQRVDRRRRFIQQDGTHERLLAGRGLYHRMFTAQAAWYRRSDDPDA